MFRSVSETSVVDASADNSQPSEDTSNTHESSTANVAEDDAVTAGSEASKDFNSTQDAIVAEPAAEAPVTSTEAVQATADKVPSENTEDTENVAFRPRPATPASSDS